MELGYMIRFGKIVPGREEAAMTLFVETTAYFEDLKKKGEVTFFEPFLSRSFDQEEFTGFFIFKATPANVFKILEDEAFKVIYTKANLLVDHLTSGFLSVGDGLLEQIDRFNKARVDLNF